MTKNKLDVMFVLDFDIYYMFKSGRCYKRYKVLNKAKRIPYKMFLSAYETRYNI